MNEFLAANEHLLEKPIIFFGVGRSGTTVISEVIFQHEDLAWHSNYQELFPKFAGINYLRRAFDNKWWRAIGINTQNSRSFKNFMLFRPIERYDFWEALVGEARDFARGFLLNEKATPAERERIRTHFAKMVKYQKRTRLALKLTGPARLEYLMSVFPDAQFVNVIRDPIAIIRSWLEVHWNLQITEQLWWRGAYSDDELARAKQLHDDKFLFATFQYKKLKETEDAELKKMRPDIYTVSYEDFTQHPKDITNTILQFLHLTPSKLIDGFLNKVIITNRNDRQSASEQTEVTEEIKNKMLALINS